MCLELQQNRSWIKGLGKNPFTHSLKAVPFVRGHRSVVPSDSEKHRRVYTSSNVCHSHEWRVDTASGKTLKKRNACLHAVRQAVEKKIACIYGLRSEGVNTHSVFCEFGREPYQHATRGRDIVQDDVYTRKCFSESEGTRFGGPGQKALPSMNEFLSFVDFCLIDNRPLLRSLPTV